MTQCQSPVYWSGLQRRLKRESVVGSNPTWVSILNGSVAELA